MTPNAGAVWRPTKDVTQTFPRKVLAVEPSRTGRAYDRVRFCRVLKDGSSGETQSCYAQSWKDWVRKFAASAEDARPVPDFPAAGKGVSFYAKDSDGQWHYVNHAGMWCACPSPVR
jgi:hypothetical protein